MSKTNTIRIKDLVDSIVNNLDCSQKTLCSFIGVSPTALSTSLDKPIQDCKDNKVGGRLVNLVYVVETLKKDVTLSSPLISKVLVTPCYPLEDGTMLDVVSAIHAGDIKREFLVEIADKALKFLRSKYESDKRPAMDGLYSRIASIG